MKIIRFLIFFLVICISFHLVIESQIFFGITPIRVEHKIDKGENLTDAIWVRNNGDSPLRLRVYTENWYLKYDGTPVFIGAKPISYSCREWIKVNPTDFRLMPKEIKLVRYTITVPQDIQNGGYHCAISFENVPITPKKKTSAMFFTGKIACVIYVKVGDVEPIGKIFDLRISQKNNSTNFIILIRNESKTHFRTKGKIEVKNLGNNKTFEVMIPNVVVLPESEREIKCVLNRELTNGKYQAFCKIDIGREELIGFIKEFVIGNEK